MAIPRGSASDMLSGILGSPVEFEKRTQTGVLVALKCGASESLEASGDGVKVPAKIVPFAWAILNR